VKFRLLPATAIGLVLAVTAAVTWQQLAAAAPEPPPVQQAKADNFLLIDQTGFAHELYRMKDLTAVVLVAQQNGDAASRKAAKTLSLLQSGFPHAAFFMLNSNLADNRPSIAAEIKAQGFGVPVLDDDLQLVGEALDIAETGEAVVIDPKTWRIVYRGAVDETLAERKSGGYLAEALAALTTSRPVAVASTPQKGVKISFPERAKTAQHAAISYTNTIVPILESKCVDCHQAGGIGPFPMSSYEIVKGYSPMIREVIRTDRMPPWHADPAIGKFDHDKSLTPDEVKTLVHWIEAGSPRGAGEDKLAEARHVAPDWPLGKPDLVLDIPAYTLPASGVVDYQYPYSNNPLTEGRWLKASTIKPGSRQGVHHVLTGYMDKPPADGRAATGSWGASVGGYAVGSESIRMPTDVGTFIPPGGAIGFQMHYTSFGKEVTDKSQVALYFYKDGEKPSMMMRQSVVIDSTIEIPPNTALHKEVAYLKFPKDAVLYSAFPHAHYRGIYTDVVLHYPDGTTKTLMSTPRYDFNWQREYEFTEPVKIPAGSKLVSTYVFDNSKGNPANPNPEERVLWGEQSFQEMLYTAVRFRWADETVEHPTNYDQLMSQNRVIGMMDDNLDERLQKSELRGRFAEMLTPAFDKVDANHDGGIDLGEFGAARDLMRPAAASSAASGSR